MKWPWNKPQGKPADADKPLTVDQIASEFNRIKLRAQSFLDGLEKSLLTEEEANFARNTVEARYRKEILTLIERE